MFSSKTVTEEIPEVVRVFLQDPANQIRDIASPTSPTSMMSDDEGKIFQCLIFTFNFIFNNPAPSCSRFFYNFKNSYFYHFMICLYFCFVLCFDLTYFYFFFAFFLCLHYFFLVPLAVE